MYSIYSAIMRDYSVNLQFEGGRFLHTECATDSVASLTMHKIGDKINGRSLMEDGCPADCLGDD